MNEPVSPEELKVEGEKKIGAETSTEAPNYYEQMLKIRAEFDNYRKRVDREKPELYKLGRMDILSRFIPLYDLLKKAHEEIQNSHAESELAKGMEGIFKEFEKIFKEEGISAIEALNKPFDPLIHEVLGTVEKPGVEDGTVVEVSAPIFFSPSTFNSSGDTGSFMIQLPPKLLNRKKSVRLNNRPDSSFLDTPCAWTLKSPKPRLGARDSHRFG